MKKLLTVAALLLLVYLEKPMCQQPLQLYFKDTTYVEPDTEFTLSLKVNQCTDLGILQFSIQWDNTVIMLQNAELGPFDLTYLINTNGLQALWADPAGAGQTLTDSTSILDLHFKSVNQQPVTTTISLTNTPLPLDAYRVVNGNPEPLAVEANNGTVIIRTCSTALELGTAQFLCPDKSILLQPNCMDCETIYWNNGAPGGDFLVTIPQQVVAFAKGPFDCTARDTVQILPAANPSVILPVTTVQCGTDMVSLEAQSTGAVTYLWSNGTPTSNTTVEQAGTYSVTITNTEACTVSASTDVVQHLSPTVDWEVEQPDCSDPFGNITISDISGAFSPYLHALNTPTDWQASTIFDDLGSGDYDIILQDADGCVFNTGAAQLIAAYSPEIDILPNLISLIQGDSVAINALIPANYPVNNIASIQWIPNDLLTFGGNSWDDQLNPIAKPANSTTLIVELISTDGCTVSDSIVLQVQEPITEHIYAPNVFTPDSGDENSRFMLFGRENEVLSVVQFSIFDRWGSLIFHQENAMPNEASAGWDGKIKNKPAETGVYAWLARIMLMNGKMLFLQGEVALVK